ncbi:MAG: DNA double-strand break repair nuclease NurA [Candidatus Nezhaarchaeota archaeon]|nr:DNA double-strand break repair nuclease NurA [Candidatus Nezhaarchaeota archaeon]
MSIWEEDIKEIERAFETFKKIGGKKEISSRALDHWIKVENLSYEGSCEFVGVDGSFLVSPLTFSTFYLARAIAIAPSLGSFKASKSEVLESTNDDQVRQHAEAVMARLEVEVASRALTELTRRGKEFMLLFDGSVSSLILHRAILHRSPISHYSYYIATCISKELSEVAEEGFVVFVAKRSSSSIYDEERLPDMILFSSMPRGYSKPRVVSLSGFYNVPEEELNGLSLSPKLKTITLSYVRLTDDGPLLRIEVPGVLSESEMHDVVAKLSSVSPVGYPVPLLAAHNSVKLRRTTLRRALSLVDIRLRTGREALREAFT